MDKQHEKREDLEERPKAKIHLDSLRATLKKVPNWKTPGHDGIQGYWLKKFTSIYERLTIEMLTRNRHIRIDDKRKDYLDPKRPLPKKPPPTTTRS